MAGVRPLLEALGDPSTHLHHLLSTGAAQGASCRRTSHPQGRGAGGAEAATVGAVELGHRDPLDPQGEAVHQIRPEGTPWGSSRRRPIFMKP